MALGLTLGQIGCGYPQSPYGVLLSLVQQVAGWSSQVQAASAIRALDSSPKPVSCETGFETA